VVGVLSGPVCDVVGRLVGFVTGEVELGDQNPKPHPTSGVDIRDVPDQQVAVPYVEIVPLVLQFQKIGTKSDWST
jgi:hypothetical protein